MARASHIVSQTCARALRGESRTEAFECCACFGPLSKPRVRQGRLELLPGAVGVARNIIAKALDAPIRQIADNGGIDGSVVADNILEKASKNYGYDANAGQYCDLMKAGVIDPTKVARVALENAASIASMILTTEAAIADKEEEAPPMMPPGGGGMPGMM